MTWRLFPLGRRQSRTIRRMIVPICEAVEQRTMLSASASTIPAGLGAAVFDHQLRDGRAVQSVRSAHSAIGTIAGTITNAGNDRGIKGISVKLINSSGRVVCTTSTNSLGQYQFEVAAHGPYVVRAVVPPRFVQTSPTFVYSPPEPSAGNLPFESPINITGRATNLSKYLAIKYHDTKDGQVTITSKDVVVEAPSSKSDSIDVNGREFGLEKLHFHAPSENHVDGRAYSMEEHFVNMNAAGAISVLGVFLKLGAHNPALQPILNAATAEERAAGAATTASTPIDFAGLLPKCMQGWFFQGSLTTSPYSQPINWFVFKKPITLDQAQLAQYKQVAEEHGFYPNARKIQPLGGRKINKFTYNVNFQNGPVAGLNFTFARRTDP
jgi:carbonic anhydrase